MCVSYTRVVFSVTLFLRPCFYPQGLLFGSGGPDNAFLVRKAGFCSQSGFPSVEGAITLVSNWLASPKRHQHFALEVAFLLPRASHQTTPNHAESRPSPGPNAQTRSATPAKAPPLRSPSPAKQCMPKTDPSSMALQTRESGVVGGPSGGGPGGRVECCGVAPCLSTANRLKS